MNLEFSPDCAAAWVRGGSASQMGVCVGLDDPDTAQRTVEKFRASAAAFKLNPSFYGGDAARVREIVRLCGDVPVIYDCKYGDVGHSAEAFAASVPEGVWAVTVSPYVDCAEAFRKRGLFVFVLCLTSDATAGQPFLDTAYRWGGRKGIGLVVAANRPREAAAVRRLVGRNTLFLCPGIGPQNSGSVRDDLDAASAAVGPRALFAVSRAAGQLTPELMHPHAAVARLIDGKARTEGDFQLKGGASSAVFYNVGAVADGCDLAVLAGHLAARIEDQYGTDAVLLAMPYKAIPLVAAVCALTGMSFAYARKEAKDHGEGGDLVGTPLAGRDVVVVD